MFSVQWLGARGLNRGKPGLPGGHGRRLAAFAILMAATVFETGCQSGPFSSCGSCGTSGLLTRTTSFINRTFHRNKGTECCGSQVSDGGCISSGVPVEAGAPVIVPGTTVIPGAATPSNVSPLDTPQSLEALPNASPGPAPSIRRIPSSPGSKTGTSYETQRPEYPSGRSRSDNLAHTLISTPVPATRSAQDVASARAREGSQGTDNVLDHLPPLDLPAEVSDKTATPPVAPAVERKPQNPTPASDHLSGRSSSDSDASRARSAAPEPATAVGGAPGIARFVAVDLKLAGGSTPSSAGLNWLVEKGYKTVVDLREPSETDAAFIAEVTRRGLRYIALPVNLKSIDKTHASRFNFELALSDARPLYFFDADGTRAGAFWYIRRITLDRVTSQIARREAEELGLNNQEYWLAATRYVEQVENPRRQVSGTSGASESPVMEKAAGPAAGSSTSPRA
jgi:protein tyrosine phosphatase (PTP) superfamily phosphohydrolase (DUF442 family)